MNSHLVESALVLDLINMSPEDFAHSLACILPPQDEVLTPSNQTQARPPFPSRSGHPTVTLARSMKFSLENPVLKAYPGLEDELTAFNQSLVVFSCYFQARELALIPYSLRAAIHNRKSPLPIQMPSPGEVYRFLRPHLEQLPSWDLPDATFANYLITQSLSPQALNQAMITEDDVRNVYLPAIYAISPSGIISGVRVEDVLRSSLLDLYSLYHPSISSADEPTQARKGKSRLSLLVDRVRAIASQGPTSV